MILITSQEKPDEDIVPLLSASQIDGYLDCPYKWFSQRRLRLSDTDANFGPMEKGTFIHRVLELTFQKHLASQLGIEAGDLLDYFDAHDIAERIDNSFITKENIDEFKKLAAEEFQSHYDHQFMGGSKRGQQLLVPHNLQERLELRNILADVFLFLDWHVDKLKTFEPRLFEYRFGDSRHKDIEYAGVRFTGSIDRIDVDEDGNAVIIDYKYKKFKSKDSYALYIDADMPEFVLPRHVQTLIYAQVLRRARADLSPIASIYLSPMSNDVSGAFANESFFKRIMGGEVDASKYHKLIVNGKQDMTFFDMLDRTEELIAQEIDKMRRGDIPANPKDADACKWCPVAFCEKRKND